MPWSETTPVGQKTQFIADYLRQTLCVPELCDLYGISRKTAYKWIERYVRQGPPGLDERRANPNPLPTKSPSPSSPPSLRPVRPPGEPRNLLPLLAKRY